jgi:hypothetical protein
MVGHIISDEDVCQRVGNLMNALATGGEDPADIDLTDLAVKFFVRDLTYKALDAGISLGTPRWSPTPSGDVEVVFSFAGEKDAALFKLWFN